MEQQPGKDNPMLDDDGSTAVTVADAEARLIGEALVALSALARLRLAVETVDRPDVDLDDVPTPPLRIVVDDGADLLGIGVQTPEGGVEQLAGYRLSVVRALLVKAAEGRLRNEDGGPTQWH